MCEFIYANSEYLKNTDTFLGDKVTCGSCGKKFDLSETNFTFSTWQDPALQYGDCPECESMKGGENVTT